MSIRAKIITAFVITILVTIFACVFIYLELRNIKESFSNTLDESLPQTYSNAELNRLVMVQASQVQSYIMGKDTKEAIDSRRDEINTMISDLEKSINKDNEKEQQLLANLKEKVEIMYNGFDEAMAIKDSEGTEAASKYYIDSADLNVNNFMDDSIALFSEVTKGVDEAQKTTNSDAKTALIITNIAIIIVIVVGIVFTVVLSKSIAKPMHILEKHVQEISNGNLTIEPLNIQSKDEIGSLAKTIDNLKDTLTNLLMSLSDGATHLSATSEELTASTEEVNNASHVMLNVIKEGSENAKTMAQSATESATAMDETALAVQKIAESSQELFNFATETEHIASEGTNNIKAASEQMLSIYESTKLTTELIQKLSKQSGEIENITQVITGITEQTNLLALNAAIEAARAGEHGKGFAVVADEVRKLAEESNRSAGQIVALTNEIQQDTKNVEVAVVQSLNNVQKGVGIIDNAGNSFEKIVNAISNMKSQIEDVSAVTEEISAAAEQVAASVTEIARSAELTNRNVRESFKSAETQTASIQEVLGVASDLSKRAQEMQQTVSEYKF